MTASSGGPLRAALAHAIALALATLPVGARAIVDRADVDPSDPVPHDRAVAWKFTAGRYAETGEPDGVDLNLRGNTEDWTFWVGGYTQGTATRQLRAGLERQTAFGLGRILWSGQLASGGFVGGSVTWEASAGPDAPVFGLLGLGRTNLRPYVNLNFDPNDSILVGGGWRIGPGAQLTLYTVRDDRLGTGQTVTHAVYRRDLGHRGRVTLDAFDRRGRESPGAELRKGRGLALTFDHGPWFVRIARDPGANFTASDMTRLSVGRRF